MTPHVRATRDEVNNNSHEKLCRPSFFQFFSHDCIEQLEIPRRFWKNNTRALSRHNVILNDSSGGNWKVELAKPDKKVFLKDGWKRFYENNQVVVNDMLLFTHLEGSTFEVRIFGMNGMEKIKGTKQEIKIPKSKGPKIPAGASTEKRKRGRPHRKKDLTMDVELPSSSESKQEYVCESVDLYSPTNPGEPTDEALDLGNYARTM